MKRNPFACLASGTLFILAFLCVPAGAASPRWPEGPYRYIVVDQEITEVLTEFGRNTRMPIQISKTIEGRLRGRLPIVSAQEFFTRLCESYGLVWYFDGSTLHVSSESEMRTELIQLGAISPEDFLATLEKLQISDRRYPVRITADAAVITVSGPPAYVSLVRQTRDTLMRAQSPQAREVPDGDEPRVRVFRGKS